MSEDDLVEAMRRTIQRRYLKAIPSGSMPTDVADEVAHAALAVVREREAAWERFGRDVMQAWPEGGIDGGDLQDIAIEHGIIREAPGGFDPEKHDDPYSAAEPGDRWFEIVPRPAAPCDAGDVAEMRLCESVRTVLKPGQLYRFTVDDACPSCREVAAQSAPPGDE